MKIYKCKISRYRTYIKRAVYEMIIDCGFSSNVGNESMS
jgi:hypothetical protein